MALKLCGVVLCTVLLMMGIWRFTVAAPDRPGSPDQPPPQQSPQQPSAPLQELKVGQASPDQESMLQRFVNECVLISPGSLKVPREARESALTDELVVAGSYRICRFETTQELYQAVTGVNPSRWPGPRNSVEQVSYSDALRFCNKLTSMLHSRQLIAADEIVRLPSPVEWEFACRAGAKTKYCFGDSVESADGEPLLDLYAWHAGNAAGNDPSVGSLKSNQWQLADVHGYLWEFTQAEIPNGDDDVSGVQVWGGSWRASPLECGCASVREVSRTLKAPDLGFRCVISKKVDLKNASGQ